jgi:hypothetical protein
VGLEVTLGLTWNAPSDLRVVQRGYPDTPVQNTRFEGRDLEWFPYYTARLWYGSTVGWRYELELIHQKLYLSGSGENGEILDHFQSSDGFNYLLFNLAYAVDVGVRLVPRFGLGVIIAHPETTVRGRSLGTDGDPSGYQFSGWGAQVAVGLEPPWILGPRLEGKFTLGYSRLNIADGYAEGWFKAFHTPLGLGYP